jgi:hypothetical protein
MYFNRVIKKSLWTFLGHFYKFEKYGPICRFSKFKGLIWKILGDDLQFLGSIWDFKKFIGVNFKWKLLLSPYGLFTRSTKWLFCSSVT